MKHDGATNAKGIAATTELLDSLESGLVFVNLVETDQVYGHRHDVEVSEALKQIDAAVARWLEMLRDGDLLILADHGVDPDAPHTDHTREYSPLLAVFAGQDGRRHDGPLADVGASVLRWLTGRDAPELPGRRSCSAARVRLLWIEPGRPPGLRGGHPRARRRARRRGCGDRVRRRRGGPDGRAGRCPRSRPAARSWE